MEELFELRGYIEKKDYSNALLLLSEMEEMSLDDKTNKRLPDFLKTFQTIIGHVHASDNGRQKDDHLPIGKGKINFDAFFESLNAWAPDATVSIEVIAEPQAPGDRPRVRGAVRRRAPRAARRWCGQCRLP